MIFLFFFCFVRSESFPHFEVRFDDDAMRRGYAHAVHELGKLLK
jgi:hypothetical protein